MDFKEALTATERELHCKVAEWLDDIDPGTKTEILAATQTVTIHRLFRAVKLMGFDGGPTTWARHFNGLCKCQK